MSRVRPFKLASSVAFETDLLQGRQQIFTKTSKYCIVLS